MAGASDNTSGLFLPRIPSRRQKDTVLAGATDEKQHRILSRIQKDTVLARATDENQHRIPSRIQKDKVLEGATDENQHRIHNSKQQKLMFVQTPSRIKVGRVSSLKYEKTFPKQESSSNKLQRVWSLKQESSVNHNSFTFQEVRSKREERVSPAREVGVVVGDRENKKHAHSTAQENRYDLCAGQPLKNDNPATEKLRARNDLNVSLNAGQQKQKTEQAKSSKTTTSPGMNQEESRVVAKQRSITDLINDLNIKQQEATAKLGAASNLTTGLCKQQEKCAGTGNGNKISREQKKVEGATIEQACSKTNQELQMKTLEELQRKLAVPQTAHLFPTMIPEPDYSDCEEDQARNRRNKAADSGKPEHDEDGLILPKKITNPCLESAEKKGLHRELKFNQKVGKNVIGQKSELQKAMEKHKDQQVRKELEKEKISNKSAFEKVLGERAKRLEELEKKEEEELKITEASGSEFLKVHAKVRARLDSQ